MVNSRDSLSTIPKMNNDANPYIITLDIYKEGYWAYDISNYYKGRVDDNGTPFMVRWYEHGQIKNVHGMRPFIRGTVGQHTIDDKTDPDNPKITPSPDCSQIDQTGETTDTLDGGIAVYRMVNQCFTQEGMFYGEIGLKDSQGMVLSSVDIAFKVLGGRMNMIGARKFYVSEFEKALADFEDEIKKLHNDFNTQTQTALQELEVNYSNIAKNAHDSAVAAQSEIDAVRANIKKASDSAGDIQTQIDGQNLVTRREFNNLSSEIVNQFKRMNVKADTYPNEDAMKSANPNGTDDICITADNMHKWIWLNQSWIDCGQMEYATINPDEEKALYSNNPDNLILNSDIKSDDYWTGNVNFNISAENSLNGSNVIVLNNSQQIDNPKVESFAQSADFELTNHKTVSFGADINVRDMEKGHAELQIVFANDDGSLFIPEATAISSNSDDNSFERLIVNNSVIPEGATRAHLAFAIYGNGVFKIRRPQANFDKNLSPYSVADYEQTIRSSSDNLLFNYPINLWNSHITQGKVAPDSQNLFNGKITTHLNSQSGYNYLTSPRILVSADSDITIYAPTRIDDYNSDALAQIQIFEYSTLTSNDGKQIVFNVPKTKYWSKNIFQVHIDSQYRYVEFRAVLENSISGNFANMYVNVGLNSTDPKQITKNVDEITQQSKNLLASYPITSWFDTGSNISSVKSDDQTTYDDNPSIAVDTTALKNGGWLVLIPQYLSIKPNSTISIEIPSIISNFNQEEALYLQIQQYAKLGDPRNYNLDINFPLKPSEDWVLNKFEDIKLDKNTTVITLAIASDTVFKGNFGNAIINLGDKCIPYSIPEKFKELEKAITNNIFNDLPQISINANNINDNYVNGTFTFTDKSRKINGYLQIAFQGDSSKSYPKKNYKIKLFQDQQLTNKYDIKFKSSWLKDNTFNLKANWIDATQARNLVNADLFYQATASTPFENKSVEAKLSKSQKLGQMQGFPVELSLNGQYWGLYTLNTKKDGKSFGMSKDNLGEEAITSELASSHYSDPNQTIDGKDYATIIQDSANDDLKDNFKKFITFITTSSDDDFRTHLQDYIDVHSVINVMLFGTMSQMWDSMTKSSILLTWNNGKYFYNIPYDLDSTWNLFWNGSKLTDDDPSGGWGDDFGMLKNSFNTLWSRVYNLFLPEIKEQYSKLRSGVWSTANIISDYKKFIDNIPEDSYEREHLRWPNIPSLKLTDFCQLQNDIIQRTHKLDDFFIQNTNDDTTKTAEDNNSNVKPATPQAQPTEPNKDSDKQ